MSRSPRWGYTGLVIGVSAALGVWLLHQAGWLAAWDGFFYDRLLSVSARWKDPQPRVLLLRLSRDGAWSDADAIQTLNVLTTLGARAVVFDFLPVGQSREFFERAAELGIVVLGRELRPDPDNPDRLRLEAWPSAAAGLDLPWGVVHLPPSLNGIHRSQQMSVASGEASYPTLEGRAAMVWSGGDGGPPLTGSFLINFVGGPGSLPNVSVSRMLEDGLIPEMVQGRIVLVGHEEGLLGLETPVSRGGTTLSLLEFRGNAIQTLLDNNPIRPMGWAGALALLIGLGLASSLLYQRAHSAAGARLVLGVLLLCALAAWAALWFFRIWLPLGPLVLAQGGQFALTLVYKTRMTNRALNEMRLHVLNQIKERFRPEDAASPSAYWDAVVSMIHQVLETRRMVFLERIPRTRELREARSVHCRFEDLKETARTLDAGAFALPLTSGEPFRATGILTGGPAPEVEYICPLIFAGEVQGIWIVSLETAKAAEIPQLEKVLARFSRQIARLLHRRTRTAATPSPAERLQTWFSAEKEDRAYRELRSTADTLEEYYDVLETVLNRIGTAMIVYDLLGRVLKANEPLLALLRAEDFAPAKASEFEFLCHVTGREGSEVRSLMRTVLLDGTPASLSIHLKSQGDRQFLMRLYPLTDLRADARPPEPPAARGMVCELIETTSLSTLASLKSVVADRLGVELRDHMAAIEMSAALLEIDRFSDAQRRVVLDAMHHKIRTCVGVLSECQKYLGRTVDSQALNCFPLDGLEALNQVCARFNASITRRPVALEIRRPRLMDPVLATPRELDRLFTAALELLSNDAAENTALDVEVVDASDSSTFRFANCGFGIPNDRLQQVLNGPEPPASEDFRVLRDARTWVDDWGGRIEITSEVGRGYEIRLQLRQFKLATAQAALPA